MDGWVYPKGSVPAEKADVLAERGEEQTVLQFAQAQRVLAMRGEGQTLLQSARAQRFRLSTSLAGVSSTGETQTLEPVTLLRAEPSPCRPGDRLHLVAAPLGLGTLSLWERSPAGQLRLVARHPLRQYLGGEVEVADFSAAGVAQPGQDSLTWPEVPAQPGIWSWTVLFSAQPPPLKATAEWLQQHSDGQQVLTFRCEVIR